MWAEQWIRGLYGELPKSTVPAFQHFCLFCLLTEVFQSSLPLEGASKNFLLCSSTTETRTVHMTSNSQHCFLWHLYRQRRYWRAINTSAVCVLFYCSPPPGRERSKISYLGSGFFFSLKGNGWVKNEWKWNFCVKFNCIT